jgi:uncharacterized protein involved in exopolysaccharide biosynthesis
VTEPESGNNVREIMKGPPSGYFIVVPDPQNDAADDLATFPTELFSAWRLLLATALSGGLIAFGIGTLMPPKFRAQAMIAPVTQQEASSGAGNALRQLGGIASLAGVEFNMAGGRREEYFATLNSKGLARDFIQAQNLLPILFADRWDPEAKQWRPGKKPPTLGEAVRRFTGAVSIDEDRRSSLVTVTVDWYSPQLAAQWANGLVEMVNDRLRADAIRSAQSSLEYLDKELAKTNVVEIRQAIYRVTEEQVSNAMLANVQREYAFRFVDRAVPPDRKNSPKRAVMGAVGAAVGLFLGIMVVYVRRVRARRPELHLRRG